MTLPLATVTLDKTVRAKSVLAPCSGIRIVGNEEDNNGEFQTEHSHTVGFCLPGQRVLIVKLLY